MEEKLFKVKEEREESTRCNVAKCKSDVELDISLVVMLSMSSHLDEWILHSSCTYNMYLIREWFFELLELDGGVVYMGNDSPCKITGIGSINLTI